MGFVFSEVCSLSSWISGIRGVLPTPSAGVTLRSGVVVGMGATLGVGAALRLGSCSCVGSLFYSGRSDQGQDLDNLLIQKGSKTTQSQSIYKEICHYVQVCEAEACN